MELQLWDGPPTDRKEPQPPRRQRGHTAMGTRIAGYLHRFLQVNEAQHPGSLAGTTLRSPGFTPTAVAGGGTKRPAYTSGHSATCAAVPTGFPHARGSISSAARREACSVFADVEVPCRARLSDATVFLFWVYPPRPGLSVRQWEIHRSCA